MRPHLPVPCSSFPSADMPVARRSTPYPRPHEEDSPSLSGSNYSPTPPPQTTIATPEPTSEAADAFLGSQIVLPTLPVLAPPITLKIPAARTKRARKPSSKPTTAGSRGGRGASRNTTLFRLDDAGKYNRVPKPRNAFFVFRAEYLQSLLPSADKSCREPRYVGDQWKALSADARVPYQVKAASEAAEYRALLDHWADDGTSGESNASVGQPAGIVIPDEVLTAPTRIRKGRGRPKNEIQDGRSAGTPCMSAATVYEQELVTVTVQVKVEDTDIDLASLEAPAVDSNNLYQLADVPVPGPVEPELSELSPLQSTPVLVQNELDASVDVFNFLPQSLPGPSISTDEHLLYGGWDECNASESCFGNNPDSDSDQDFDPWYEFCDSSPKPAAQPTRIGTGILMQSSASSTCDDAFYSITAGLDEGCKLREGWWTANDGFPVLPSVGDILDLEARNAV
uniref:HMG box domain-containing protein n=1 Tax=Mycena chlorophos TaxID=658473 RepID=A0ABQ0L8G0_MYCCL|nr:predicted protein [Mycena chlorophos]